MEIILTALTKVASGIGPFFLLLGLLIFVHELGHYLVAVYFGVRVETFSLGFGKKIFSRKRGDTTYCLSIIPLGGYVKMYGDDPTAEVPEDQKKYSFLHKPVWPRIAIVLAGPLMNLFFAMFVFAAVGMLGEDTSGNRIGDIETNSTAYSFGFRSGDTITKINGSATVQWREIKEAIESNADSELVFEVMRENTNAVESVRATPRLAKNPFLFSTQRMVGNIEGLSTESIATLVSVPDDNSLAAKVGFRTFDVIEKINGEEVQYWRQIEPFLQKNINLGEIKLTVKSYASQASANKKASDEASREIAITATSFMPNAPLIEQLGLHRADLNLLSVRPKSPAEKAGLQSGDLVVSIDGNRVKVWQEVLDRIKSYKPEQKTIQFTVLRKGVAQEFNIAPEQIDLPTEQGAMESRYAIGVVPAIMTSANNIYFQQYSNPLRAIAYGVEQSWVWSKLIAMSLVRLVQNEVSARNIGGVITIGRVASKSFEAGVVAFLKMMAIISINLFLLNLLPVPVLDGGHLVFFTFEAIRGKPISFKKLEIAQQVGLAILMSLMVFALFNDITHLISSW